MTDNKEIPKDYLSDDFMEVGGVEGSRRQRDPEGEVVKFSTKKVDTSSVKDRRVIPRNRPGIELE